jgi:hypothetical protein
LAIALLLVVEVLSTPLLPICDRHTRSRPGLEAGRFAAGVPGVERVRRPRCRLAAVAQVNAKIDAYNALVFDDQHRIAPVSPASTS